MTIDLPPEEFRRLGYQAVDRGDIDDLAPAAPPHTFHAGLDRAEVSLQVYVHDLVPIALFGAEQRAEVRVGSRVIDQDIHPAFPPATRTSFAAWSRAFCLRLESTTLAPDAE
jgi:hypothetical protein